MQSNEEDKLCWRFSDNRGFKVSSYYKALVPTGVAKFPQNGIWKLKFLTRVAFFIWTTSLGRILTAENLQKRNINVVSWFCMCKEDRETMNHLLVNCPVASDLWDVIFTLFEVQSVMPKGVIELLSCWKNQFRRHRNSAIWKAVPHCLIW